MTTQQGVTCKRTYPAEAPLAEPKISQYQTGFLAFREHLDIFNRWYKVQSLYLQLLMKYLIPESYGESKLTEQEFGKESNVAM
jgi:hypothetical protein